MKKLITLLLVLGFSMPVMADVGENKDDNVKCEEIFQGSEVKNNTAVPGEDKPSSTNTNDQ